MIKLMTIVTMALAAMPAAAAEPLPTERRIVETADLDLGSAIGLAALDRRIERAVADVCGKAADVDLSGRNAVRACRVETLAKAYDARDRRMASASAAPIVLAAR